MSGVGPVLAGWAVLVLCRYSARMVAGGGAGPRGSVGLALLTAAVNAYWLLAGPALVATHRAVVNRRAASLWFPLLLVAMTLVVALEPLWYWAALTAFHGRPLAWPDAMIERSPVNVLITLLILVAGWASDGYRRAVVRQRQQEELASLLVDTELRALMLQLQPHFLFNTLQLAAEAAYEDVDTARRIVYDLQLLLRRSVEFEEKSVVSVADEIDFLRAYVAIQRRRFGARLVVDIDVDPAAVDLLLPPLLLQPLVENSIQHGLGPLARDGRIVVRVRRDEQHLNIEVRDNGVGLVDADERGTGMGLGVTRRRLRALFPNNHTIEAVNVPEGGACVSIVLPIAPAANVLTAAHDTTLALPSRWWSSRWTITLAMALVVIACNWIGTVWFVDRTSVEARMSIAAIVMWVPAQLLALAVIVVVWKGRATRLWLARRDSESRLLADKITLMRGRVAALRTGKDLIVPALARLAFAVDPAEFDQLIVRTSHLIRSLLTLGEGGRSTVELESDLAVRYFDVLRSADHAPVHAAAMHAAVDISRAASNASMPSGSLPALLGSLMTDTGTNPSELHLDAEASKGLLSISMHLVCEPTPTNHAAITPTLVANVRELEGRLQQSSDAGLHLHVEKTVRGYVARMSLPVSSAPAKIALSS